MISSLCESRTHSISRQSARPEMTHATSTHAFTETSGFFSSATTTTSANASEPRAEIIGIWLYFRPALVYRRQAYSPHAGTFGFWNSET